MPQLRDSGLEFLKLRARSRGIALVEEEDGVVEGHRGVLGIQGHGLLVGGLGVVGILEVGQAHWRQKMSTELAKRTTQ